MKPLSLAAAFAALLVAPVALAQAAEPVPDAGGMTSTLLSFGITLLPYVLAGLAGVLVWALATWRSKLGAQAGESRLAQWGARLLLVAEGIVRDLEVTMKPELKAAAADGVLSPAELKRLKDEALKRLKESLGEHGMAELREVLQVSAGSLGLFLSGIIEKALDSMKVTKAMAKGGVHNVTVLPTVSASGENLGAIGAAAALAGAGAGPQTPRG